MQQINLKKDDLIIATGYEGQSIKNDEYGINFSNAEVGMYLTVDPQTQPEDVYDELTGELIESFEGWTQFPPAGVYIIEAAPVVESPPLPEPTIEEIRASMPVIKRVDFMRMMVSIVTEDWPDGVLPSDIQNVINQIPDRKTRELTLWEFENAEFFERSNPLIDGVGSFLSLTPEQIDGFWTTFVASN